MTSDFENIFKMVGGNPYMEDEVKSFHGGASEDILTNMEPDMIYYLIFLMNPENTSKINTPGQKFIKKYLPIKYSDDDINFFKKIIGLKSDDAKEKMRTMFPEFIQKISSIGITQLEKMYKEDDNFLRTGKHEEQFKCFSNQNDKISGPSINNLKNGRFLCEQLHQYNMKEGTHGYKCCVKNTRLAFKRAVNTIIAKDKIAAVAHLIGKGQAKKANENILKIVKLQHGDNINKLQTDAINTFLKSAIDDDLRKDVVKQSISRIPEAKARIELNNTIMYGGSSNGNNINSCLESEIKNLLKNTYLEKLEEINNGNFSDEEKEEEINILREDIKDRVELICGQCKVNEQDVIKCENLLIDKIQNMSFSESDIENLKQENTSQTGGVILAAAGAAAGVGALTYGVAHGAAIYYNSTAGDMLNHWKSCITGSDKCDPQTYFKAVRICCSEIIKLINGDFIINCHDTLSKLKQKLSNSKISDIKNEIKQYIIDNRIYYLEKEGAANQYKEGFMEKVAKIADPNIAEYVESEETDGSGFKSTNWYDDDIEDAVLLTNDNVDKYLKNISDESLDAIKNELLQQIKVTSKYFEDIFNLSYDKNRVIDFQKISGTTGYFSNQQVGMEDYSYIISDNHDINEYTEKSRWGFSTNHQLRRHTCSTLMTASKKNQWDEYGCNNKNALKLSDVLANDMDAIYNLGKLLQNNFNLIEKWANTDYKIPNMSIVQIKQVSLMDDLSLEKFRQDMEELQKKQSDGAIENVKYAFSIILDSIGIYKIKTELPEKYKKYNKIINSEEWFKLELLSAFINTNKLGGVSGKRTEWEKVRFAGKQSHEYVGEFLQISNDENIANSTGGGEDCQADKVQPNLCDENTNISDARSLVKAAELTFKNPECDTEEQQRIGKEKFKEVENSCKPILDTAIPIATPVASSEPITEVKTEVKAEPLDIKPKITPDKILNECDNMDYSKTDISTDEEKKKVFHCNIQNMLKMLEIHDIEKKYLSKKNNQNVAEAKEDTVAKVKAEKTGNDTSVSEAKEDTVDKVKAEEKDTSIADEVKEGNDNNGVELVEEKTLDQRLEENKQRLGVIDLTEAKPEPKSGGATDELSDANDISMGKAKTPNEKKGLLHKYYTIYQRSSAASLEDKIVELQNIYMNPNYFEIPFVNSSDSMPNPIYDLYTHMKDTRVYRKSQDKIKSALVQQKIMDEEFTLADRTQYMIDKFTDLVGDKNFSGTIIGKINTEFSTKIIMQIGDYFKYQQSDEEDLEITLMIEKAKNSEDQISSAEYSGKWAYQKLNQFRNNLINCLQQTLIYLAKHPTIMRVTLKQLNSMQRNFCNYIKLKLANFTNSMGFDSGLFDASHMYGEGSVMTKEEQDSVLNNQELSDKALVAANEIEKTYPGIRSKSRNWFQHGDHKDLSWRYHNSSAGEDEFIKYISNGKFRSWSGLNNSDLQEKYFTVINYFKYAIPETIKANPIEVQRVNKYNHDKKEITATLIQSIVAFFSQNESLNNGLRCLKGVLDFPVIGNAVSVLLWIAMVAWDDFRNEIEAMVTLKNLGMEWVETFIGVIECVSPMQIQEELTILIKDDSPLKEFLEMQAKEAKEKKIIENKEEREAAYTENAKWGWILGSYFNAVTTGYYAVSDTLDKTTSSMNDKVTASLNYIMGNNKTIDYWDIHAGKGLTEGNIEEERLVTLELKKDKVNRDVYVKKTKQPADIRKSNDTLQIKINDVVDVKQVDGSVLRGKIKTWGDKYSVEYFGTGGYVQMNVPIIENVYEAEAIDFIRAGLVKAEDVIGVSGQPGDALIDAATTIGVRHDYESDIKGQQQVAYSDYLNLKAKNEGYLFITESGDDYGLANNADDQKDRIKIGAALMTLLHDKHRLGNKFNQDRKAKTKIAESDRSDGTGVIWEEYGVGEANQKRVNVDSPLWSATDQAQADYEATIEAKARQTAAQEGKPVYKQPEEIIRSKDKEAGLTGVDKTVLEKSEKDAAILINTPEQIARDEQANQEQTAAEEKANQEQIAKKIERSKTEQQMRGQVITNRGTSSVGLETKSVNQVPLRMGGVDNKKTKKKKYRIRSVNKKKKPKNRSYKKIN